MFTATAPAFPDTRAAERAVDAARFAEEATRHDAPRDGARIEIVAGRR